MANAKTAPTVESCNVPNPNFGVLTLPCGCDKSVHHCALGMAEESRTASAYEKLRRETWDRKIDFILATFAQVVGYGNVCRFPFLVYRNGGGTFLIPYFIMFFFIGFPLFFLELALGQFCGVGATLIFPNMAPIMSGMGYGMSTIIVLRGVVYIFQSAYAIYYLFAGMSQKLPWSFCGKNQYGCVDTENGSKNISELPCYPDCLLAAEDFHHIMLGTKHFDGSWCKYGDINWPLVMCLLCAWTLVGSSLVQGIKSVVKVVYFTAPLPIIVLFILGCQCLTLDGVEDGILFYVTPDVSRLKEPQVWIRAASQIFYSLGIGTGNLHNLASYNQFNNNCFNDALLVAVADTCVSILSGFVIFSIVGFLSHETGQEIENVVKNAQEIAFITLPDAVSRMPIEHFWSFMLFIMFIALGIDSIINSTETIITSILDHNVWMRPYRAWFVALCCFIGFLCGLPMCAPQGYALMEVVDANASGWTLLLMVFLESVTVSWLYGALNFWKDIMKMKIDLSNWVKYYLVLCWLLISPAILLILIGTNFYHDYCRLAPYRCEGGEDFPVQPPAIIALSLLLWATPLSFVLLFAIVKILVLMRQKRPLIHRLMYPTDLWAPDESKPKVIATPQFKTSGAVRKTWPLPHSRLRPFWDPSKDISAQKVSRQHSGLFNNTLPETNPRDNNEEQASPPIADMKPCTCSPSAVGLLIREHID